MIWWIQFALQIYDTDKWRFYRMFGIIPLEYGENRHHIVTEEALDGAQRIHQMTMFFANIFIKLRLQSVRN